MQPKNQEIRGLLAQAAAFGGETNSTAKWQKWQDYAGGVGVGLTNTTNATYTNAASL